MRSHRKYGAIVVMDTQTLDVERVYVRMTMRDALQHFMRVLRQQLDPAYSDTKDIVQDAVNRYQFIGVDDVVGGRRA